MLTLMGATRDTGRTLAESLLNVGKYVRALGRSDPETGGKYESALHWDLICVLRPGGRLSADGVVLMQDGRFAL